MLKKVYLLPNLLTAGNLFAGFYAIISAVNGQFERAAVALIVAGVLDGLDGKIARVTGSTSRFGVEFDSLADLVSFGVAPAVLIYLWALKPYGRMGWAAAFLFVACGALRLARFNVQSGSPGKKWFIGLPIPAAAGSLATTLLLVQLFDVKSVFPGALVVFQVYLLAFLMVSSIQYRSFKDLGMYHRRPFSFLVTAVLLISIVAVHPQLTLFTLGVIYVLSGPVEPVLRRIRGSLAGAPGKSSTG
jgi:CDP-diacylglycerol--serine O-phosphatidyltransferase